VSQFCELTERRGVLSKGAIRTVECQRRALSLDPLSIPILANLALALECLGDMEAKRNACLTGATVPKV